MLSRSSRKHPEKQALPHRIEPIITAENEARCRQRMRTLRRRSEQCKGFVKDYLFSIENART
jgi:hypothetical protein